ncbi:unnamed protein product [Orchesella dallaii]|uniref:Uncharacterized protein n=1 Tax=Orchesella dallaii TaxID=48710 RepID=A0ABP1QXY8_9HEXA
MKLKILLICAVQSIHCISAIGADRITFVGTFSRLVEASLYQLPLPLTIRLAISNNSDSKLFYGNCHHIDLLHNTLFKETLLVPYLIGNNKPYMESPHKQSITTGGVTGKIEIFTYLVVFWVEDIISTSLVQSVVEKTVSRRNDRTIFITQNEEIILKLGNSTTIQGLRDKFFMTLENDGDKIWTDPLVFNKNHELIVFTSVFNLPQRNKMGGLLRGRHLRTGQSEIFHWAYVDSQDTNGNVQFAGSFYSIQVEAMKRFNYTLDVKQLDTYASIENGTWIGTTGCVLNGECDLAICLSPEYIWGYGMEFSPAISTAELIFWTNFPRSDPKWYGFLLPFSVTVWIFVIIGNLMIGMILLLTMYHAEDGIMSSRVLEAGIFLPFTLAMEQGVSQVPPMLRFRFLTLVWLMTTMVIGTAYKSLLRNNLMFPPKDEVPLTHAELADRKDYVATLYSFGELELDHFKSSTDPKIQQIYKRLKLVNERTECLHNVLLNYKQTCGAWHPPSTMLIAKFLTLNILVDPLIHSKDHVALSYMTLAFPKGSILVDTFSGIVSSITEGGIYQKFAKDETYKLKKSGVDFWKNATEYQKESKIYRILKSQIESSFESDDRPLTLSSLWVVLLFIPGGCMIGLVTCVLETQYISWKRMKVVLLHVNPAL